jgi:hypothetical protein
MRLIPIIAAISLIALAPGAAIAQGTSSTGARMAADAERASDRADDKAALAAQWKDGDRMVAEGNRMVRRSERRMTGFSRDASRHQARADRATADGLKAEASLAEGRRMIAAGGALKAQAEARFPLGPAA